MSSLVTAPDYNSVLIGSIGQALEASFGRHAASEAVIDGEVTLTYADLSQHVAALSARLSNFGVQPEQPVLIAVPRSWKEIVAVCAVIAGGAHYVRLEADVPDSALRMALEAVAATCCLVDEDDPHSVELAGRLAAISSAPLAIIPLPTDSSPEPTGTGGLQVAGSAQSTAYVAMTSGSTGKPKAVRVRHSGILRLAETESVRIRADDRSLRLASLAFDASTYEIFVPLLAGAAIVVFTPARYSPAQLGTFIATQRISVVLVTSGIFRMLCDYAMNELSSVRLLITGGEVVSARHAESFRNSNPDCQLVVAYGPTEDTTLSTVHPVTTVDPNEPIPIGRPVSRSGFAIVRDGVIAPRGTSGDIWLCGQGLATGYAGDQQATDTRFTRIPGTDLDGYDSGDMGWVDESGVLHFTGRRDSQVKINGRRVELDDVTRVLAQTSGVRDAFAFAIDTNGNKRIAAAVVAHAGGELDIMSVRAHMETQVASFMRPARYVMVDDLPVTRNGKVDVAALQEALAVSGA